MSVSASADLHQREAHIETVVRRLLHAWDTRRYAMPGGAPQALFDRERLRAQLQAADDAAVRAEMPRGAGGTRRDRRRW